jgi:hypothetical protein
VAMDNCRRCGKTTGVAGQLAAGTGMARGGGMAGERKKRRRKITLEDALENQGWR